MSDSSNSDQPKEEQQQEKAEEETPRENENPPRTGLPKVPAPMWIAIGLDPTAPQGGALTFNTNVKEVTQLLGMLEWAKANMLENHFKNLRTQLVVPRGRLIS